MDAIIQDVSSDEESNTPSDVDSDDIDNIRPSLHSLGLNKRYLPGWDRKAAFREFYQNWKDGLVESFNLDPRTFAPQWKETANYIQITVHQPVVYGGTGSRALIGYILFNMKRGSLELANFKARLEMRHLTIGGTSKYQDDRLAGIHGEGFKLAALVMRRNGHAVRISTSSSFWNFSFRGYYKDRLYCRISQPTETSLAKKEERAIVRGLPRTALISNMWEDVSVQIFKGRAEGDIKITKEEFLTWTQVSLDLAGPSPEGLVRTGHGDLILDKKFAGEMFLKGLLVAGCNPGGRTYVFGYNFAQGSINRDRERLANNREEAETIANIWGEAMASGREDIVQQYLALFRHEEIAHADVALAEQLVSKPAAEIMFACLKNEAPTAFFYSDCHSEDYDQVSIILSNLKEKPRKIPSALWKLFRRHALVRTPQEERLRIFQHSELMGEPRNEFAHAFLRLLQATLQLDNRLARVKMLAVKGGYTGIDVLYKGNGELLIHEKWFDFNKIHEEYPCDLSGLTRDTPAATQEFFCDHVVEDLIYLVVDEVRRPLKLDPTVVAIIRQGARDRIQKMPRGIKVYQTPQINELEVCWTGNETGSVVEAYGSSLFYSVILHQVSSCQQHCEELLHKTDVVDNSNRPCNCPFQIISRSISKAIFGQLDPNEAYRPMVARVGTNTFFGSPPLSVSPRQQLRSPNCPRPRASTSSLTDDETTDDEMTDDEMKEDEMTDDEMTDDAMTDVGQPSNEGAENNSSFVHRPAREKTTEEAAPLHPADVAKHANGIRNSPDATVRDKPKGKEDEAAWDEWYDNEFPAIRSQLFCASPTRVNQTGGLLQAQSDPMIGCSLISERLGCTFESDTYARIKEKSQNALEYVIHIHGLHNKTISDDTRSPHLIVTKYFFLRPESLLQVQSSTDPGEAVSSTCREVLLDFSSYEDMGGRYDAVILSISDIATVEILSDDFEVIPCVEPPLAANLGGNLFFRFARQTNGDKVAFMPIAPHLLPRRLRRGKPKEIDVPSPLLVMDLTPNILGPLEGFTASSDGAATPFACIGFDEVRHMTWRARYPHCPIYDGSPETVLGHFASGKFHLPEGKPMGQPRVALVAGENTNFRLNPANKLLPPPRRFLVPLGIVDSVVNSSLHPDFTVMQMPPALLHHSTRDRLAESVIKCLELGQTVHICLVAHKECGLVQSKSTLVMITSPLPMLQGLGGKDIESQKWSDNAAAQSKHLKDLMRVYERPNQNMTEGRRGGLVVHQFHYTGANEKKMVSNTYNHRTGTLPPEGATAKVVDMALGSSSILGNSSYWLIHPKRKDLFTVRELASLQGFRPDFIFYESIEKQYENVVNAQPPPVATYILHLIKSMVRRSQRVQLKDMEDDVARTPKRARTAIEE